MGIENFKTGPNICWDQRYMYVHDEANFFFSSKLNDYFFFFFVKNFIFLIIFFFVFILIQLIFNKYFVFVFYCSCPFLATHINPIIPIVGAILYFFTMSSLLRTTFTDPGVIPRASYDEAAYIEKQIGKFLSLSLFVCSPLAHVLN